MFRLSLMVSAAAIWLLGLWLVTHNSEDPVVLGRYSPGYFSALSAVFAVALLVSACHWAPIYRRLFATRATITLLLVSVVLSFAALELFVRTADLFGVSYYAEAGRYHLDKVADPSLVYRHRPKFRSEYQGVPVEFNELGLRERPIGPKSNGEFRILFLGDSVTFGWGVRAEDTFSRRLEVSVAQESRRPVRTVNSGVGSYNTEQELAYLRHHGLELSPDLVVLVYASNDDEINEHPFDPWTAVSLAGKSPPEVLRLLLGRCWTYRLFHHFTRFATAASPAGVDRAAPGWQRSLRALEGIADSCAGKGIPVVFLLYEHVKNAKTRALSEDIARVAAVRAIPFTSTAAWLGDADPHTLTNSIIDSHPNAAGHARLAQGMHGFLTERVALINSLKKQ